MSDFFELSPDWILAAIESVGLRPTGRYFGLNSVENRVFGVETEDLGRVVVKFYRPNRWRKEQIEEEHQFLFELLEAEVPVVSPLSFAGKSLFSYQGILYAIWPLRQGRIVEELKVNDCEQVGRLLGRLHQVGQRQSIQTRPKLDILSYAKPALDLLLTGDWIPNASLAKRYEKAALQVFSVYETLSKEIPFHRIHGDCHKGNLLVEEGRFSILDFDDFLVGPAVQDFWMLLPFGEKYSDEAWSQFLSGYELFSSYESHWRNLIEPLRGIRYVYYAAWIAKRWSDPSFPSLFPHFGTEEYWSKETQDLETKGEDLRGEQIFDGDVNLEKDISKEKLTNKDFFWDWEG